jgi:hypothetical protein
LICRSHNARSSGILQETERRPPDLIPWTFYKVHHRGYQLAELLDLDDMLPVDVQRKWQGKTRAFSYTV